MTLLNADGGINVASACLQVIFSVVNILMDVLFQFTLRALVFPFHMGHGRVAIMKIEEGREESEDNELLWL
jgi:hypothetical protein